MQNNKKVYMILTNGFDPDVRVYKEAKYLTKNGFDVKILCWDRKCEYRDKEEEIVDGIKIKRFFIPSTPGTGMKQLIPYLKFMKNVKKYLRNKEYDYLHCHDLDGAIIGVQVKNVKSKKIVFDMHEYYGTGNMKTFASIIRKIVRKIQNISYKIVYVNDKQIENISDKNKNKLIYLPNYPEKEEFQNVKHIDSTKLRVTYAGYVRHLIPLTNLIKAANELEDVEVHIYGIGECFSDIKKLENNRVFVTGAFKHNEIAKFYSNTDIIYSVYNKGNKNDETSLPTKFHEAIISKIPVMVSKDSKMEQEVKRYDIGFAVDGTNYKDIYNTLKQILNERTILNEKIENIKKISNKFIWEEQVNELVKIYE